MKPRVFLPAAVSGVLLWAAFFPLDLGVLGFVALVPWLTLVRAPVSTKRRYFAAYFGGVVFFALATEWVRVAHPMMYLSWLGLAVVMPLFWLAALAILRKLDRIGLTLAVAVPVAWVALEYCRMHFPTGFPFLKPLGAYQMIGFGWYFLGYTQHAFPQLIQIADLGGVYAVSFVVASVNGALAGVVMKSRRAQRLLRWEAEAHPQPPLPLGEGEKERSDSVCSPALSCPAPPSLPRKGVAGLGLAFVFVAASIGYGFYRLDHAPFADGPQVAAIQGNVGQGDKMGDPEGLFQAYAKLHARARAQRPDLIVWPETCCPMDWFDVATGVPQEGLPDGFGRARAKSRYTLLGEAQWGAPTLLGLTGLEWDGTRVWKYNSALLLKPLPRPDGWKPGDPLLVHSAAAGRYDKMHLVPFGEYVPLKEQLPFMSWFTPYKHEYSCRPGEHWTRFPLRAKDGRDFTFGCLICYEDSDPYLARQYIASEPVNFLVNISNDGWFDGTEEHEQHLAICRFRAIEARRAIVRSVNMGISGVIDSDGRIVALPNPDWSQSKKVEAVVTATVPIDARSPLYATLGDWIPAVCWLAALVGLVLARRTPPARAAGTSTSPRS